MQRGHHRRLLGHAAGGCPVTISLRDEHVHSVMRARLHEILRAVLRDEMSDGLCARPRHGRNGRYGHRHRDRQGRERLELAWLVWLHPRRHLLSHARLHVAHLRSHAAHSLRHTAHLLHARLQPRLQPRLHAWLHPRLHPRLHRRLHRRLHAQPSHLQLRHHSVAARESLRPKCSSRSRLG